MKYIAPRVNVYRITTEHGITLYGQGRGPGSALAHALYRHRKGEDPCTQGPLSVRIELVATRCTLEMLVRAQPELARAVFPLDSSDA